MAVPDQHGEWRLPTALLLDIRDPPIWERMQNGEAILRTADTRHSGAIHVVTEPVEVGFWD